MVDPNPARGMPLQLQRYWLTGKGAAKIRWGMPHDFDRCVRNLRKYFPKNPKGLCNILHQKALGAPPGKGHPGEMSLTAASEALMGVQDYGEVWAAPLAPINRPTSEPHVSRIFEPGSLQYRSLPLPLAFRKVSSGQGHTGSVTVGRILGTTIGPDHVGQEFAWGWGDWLSEDIVPEVKEARYLAQQGVVGVSVDPGGPVVGEVNPGTGLIHMSKYTIGGATLVSNPAFAGMRIFDLGAVGDWPDDDEDMVVPGYDGDPDYDGGSDCGCGHNTYSLTAAVMGNGWRGMPLAPREAVFDNDDAVKRISQWSGGDPKMMAKMFMWRDQRLPANDITAYRLPYGDIISGEPTMVYHAIYAAAALLSGAHGGLPNISDEEKMQLRGVISEIYPEMAKAFGDQNIRAPWDRPASIQAREDAGQASMSQWIPGSAQSASNQSVPTASFVLSAGRQDAHAAMSHEVSLGAPTVTALTVATPTTRSGYSDPVAERSNENKDGATTAVTPSGSSSSVGNCHCDRSTESPRNGSTNSLRNRGAGAQSVGLDRLSLVSSDTYTLTTATSEDRYEGSSAPSATSGLGSSERTPCSCGAQQITSKEFAMTEKVDLNYPPKSWFEKPSLTGPTPLTVTDDGQVYGHLALWDTCHRDVSMRECVLAPRSQKNYEPFRLGTVFTAEGEPVRVGKIVMDTRHAGINLGYRSAAIHYDDTGDEVAVVVPYEDEFGVVLAGAAVPEADPRKLAKLRRSPLSGDWRALDGNLELTAALAVNVPAFPVFSMDGDERLALVAAGTVTIDLDPDLVFEELVQDGQEYALDEEQEDRAWELRQLDEDHDNWRQWKRAKDLYDFAVATGQTPPANPGEDPIYGEQAMAARQMAVRYEVVEDTGAGTVPTPTAA